MAASGEGTPGTTSNGIPSDGQQLGLFRAAAEQIGIAAFEAHDRLAFSGGLGELTVDLACRSLARPARLPTNTSSASGLAALSWSGMYERVVEDDVGLAQAPEPARGDQLWIARARTHQVHFAGCVMLLRSRPCRRAG